MPRHPKPIVSPYVSIRHSGIHGRGGFARTNIAKGTNIIEYVGERIDASEADRRSERLERLHRKNPERGAVYLYEVNKNAFIDGNVNYNSARYINHSCEPNCESDIVKNRIWIIALRNIKKGEELTYNYGYDLDEALDHPCRCGASRCVKYVCDQAHWPKLQQRIANPKR